MRFLIRLSGRDEKADAGRLHAIDLAVLNAIAEAEAEKIGLVRRTEAAKVRAAMLMGVDTFEYFDREPEIEQQLALANGRLSGRVVADRSISLTGFATAVH